VVVYDAKGKIEQALMGGDLSALTPQERSAYVEAVCNSLGLNPLTRPFQYITVQGKLTLYAKRDATEQLRKRDSVSLTITAREQIGDVYIVTARATTPDGRSDESLGAVSVGNLKGEDLANAYMKAETKAKRRVTLSIVGLGWLDETEVASIPSAAALPEPSPMDAARRQCEHLTALLTRMGLKAGTDWTLPAKGSLATVEALEDYNLMLAELVEQKSQPVDALTG
jgi:hypothetical protein